MKTNLNALLIAGVFTFALPTFACIQRYGTKLDGSYQRAGGGLPYKVVQRLTDSPPRSNWIAEEANLRATARSSSADYKTQSDYAAALLHLGRAREAVSILEPLAARYGGEYEIIANLGTAYELDGQLDKALQYIRRGLEINSRSHDGSEWLHVKILEARIAQSKDANWLKTHSVAGLSFGNEALPAIPKDGIYLSENPYEEMGSKGFQLVARDITYQLHERLQFVQPPNQVVADVLFDLANLYAIVDVAENADPIYQMAVQFSEGHKPLIQSRATAVHKLAHGFNIKRTLNRMGINPIAQGFILLIAGLIAYYIYDLRRSRAVTSLSQSVSTVESTNPERSWIPPRGSP